jgi:hypothetical protein
MSMKALDPASCPPHSSARSWALPIGRNERVALRAVALMRVGQLERIDGRFGLADTAVRFQTAHRSSQIRIDEPETRWHR